MKGLTQLVLGTFINVKADIGITQCPDRGFLLLTLKHRPGNFCRYDADVHPHPEHRSRPVGKTLS